MSESSSDAEELGQRRTELVKLQLPQVLNQDVASIIAGYAELTLAMRDCNVDFSKGAVMLRGVYRVTLCGVDNQPLDLTVELQALFESLYFRNTSDSFLDHLSNN